MPGNTVKRLPYSYPIGPAPPELNLKDTGEFISHKHFKLIDDEGPFSCRAKGCYDRYHCIWYDKDKMEPDGPWNIVPPDHRIGDEDCQSFIDKETIAIHENINTQ